jgi:hypothetical protein
MKMAVFWDVAPHILGVTDQHFGGTTASIITKQRGATSQKTAIFLNFNS